VGEVPGAVGFEGAASGCVGEVGLQDVMEAFAGFFVHDRREKLDALREIAVHEVCAGHEDGGRSIASVCCWSWWIASRLFIR
jgi:hypothetical protein